MRLSYDRTVSNEKVDSAVWLPRKGSGLLRAFLRPLDIFSHGRPVRRNLHNKKGKGLRQPLKRKMR